MNEKLSYIDGIDGLKTIGCILILLRHAAYAFNYMHYEAGFLTYGGFDFYPAWVNGWVGIDVYFVLCGFLVARSWLFNPQQSYKKYALKRCFRVLPLYFIVLFLCLYGGIPYYKTPEPPTFLSLIYHLTSLQDIFIPDINIVFGSLAAELKIFLMFPLIFLFCLRQKKSEIWMISIAVLVLVLGFLVRIYGYQQFYLVNEYYTDYYMFFLHSRIVFVYCLDPVLFGVIIAYIEKRYRDKNQTVVTKKQANIIAWAGFLALLFWLLVCEHMKVITFYDAAFQPIVTALIMAVMVFGVVFGGAPSFFKGFLAQQFSRLSYALYLMHIPLIPLSYILNISYIVPAYDLSLKASFISFFSLYMVLTWLSSELLQRYVEKKTEKKYLYFFKEQDQKEKPSKG